MWGSRNTYYNLLTSCELYEHLVDINEEASEMFDRLVKQLAEQEGISKRLNAENQLLWVQEMNNIRIWGTEFINAELIYT